MPAIAFVLLNISLLVPLTWTPAWAGSGFSEMPVNSPARMNLECLSQDRSMIAMAAQIDDDQREAIQAVLEAISSETGLATDVLEVVDITEETWPDGCLGLAEDGEMCAQVLVPGWEITIESEEQRWVYRTNETGTVLRLAAETSL